VTTRFATFQGEKGKKVKAMEGIEHRQGTKDSGGGEELQPVNREKNGLEQTRAKKGGKRALRERTVSRWKAGTKEVENGGSPY